MDLEKLTMEVTRAARMTGDFLTEKLHSRQNLSIVAKGVADFVTEVDRESERRLVDWLMPLLPGAGFIAEENTTTLRGDRYNWIIDPLDGTTNFIHGVMPFSISIALIDGDNLISGVIHDPVQNECFYGWKGGGAWLNNSRIGVSKCGSLMDALIATGFPYTDFSLIDPYMKSLQEFIGKSHGIRRLGSAAVDLAYVACGRYDAFYEYHLKPWDVAAGTVIIREAGGQVCDFNGGNNFLFGEHYVATNGTIHDQFMEVIRRCF